MSTEAPKICGEKFGQHPTQRHLVAMCALPPGHDGEHDNVLRKPEHAILRRRTPEVKR